MIGQWPRGFRQKETLALIDDLVSSHAQTWMPFSRTTLFAQSLLPLSGHNPGRPDGLMGPRTRRAVAAFRRAWALPDRGGIDNRLLRCLVAVTAEQTNE